MKVPDPFISSRLCSLTHLTPSLSLVRRGGVLLAVFALFLLLPASAHAASRYWVGGGSSANWNATANTNWGSASNTQDNASVPGSADDVFFDGVGTGASNSTLSASITILSLDMTGYANTLTHNTSTTLTIAGNTFKLASGMTYTILGTSSSAITFTSTSGTTLITTAGKSIRSTTFNGVGGTFQLQDDLAFDGIPSVILTNGTFDANAKTVTFTNTAGGAISITGAFTFYNLTLTGSTNKRDIFAFSANITVSNALTINGNSTTVRILVNSNSSGTARTITAATVTVTNADFQDITGAGAGNWDLSAITGLSGDAGGNSGITFTTAVPQFWIGGTGNWSTAGEWSTSSGGAANGRVPLPQDDVTFDANSFSAGSQTVTADMARLGKNVNWTGATNSPAFAFTIGSMGNTYYGSLTLISGMSITNSAVTPQIFEGRGSFTLTSAGQTFEQAITVKMPGGTLTLQDNLILGTTRTFTLTNGTFDANGKNFTTGIFSSNNSNTRTITMGAGTWTLTGNAATIFNTGTITNLTFNRGNAIVASYSGATGTRSITNGLLPEANAPSFNITGGTDTFTFSSSGQSSYLNIDTTGFAGTINFANATTIYGNFTIASGATVTPTANSLNFRATSGTKTITSNGVNFDLPIIFNGVGGTFQLADNLAMGTTTSRALTLTNGTLDLSDKTLTHFGVMTIGSGSGTRAIAGSGTYNNTLDTAVTVWTYSGTNFTTSGTWTAKFSSTTNNAQTFTGGGATYKNIWFSRGASTANITIQGSNTFLDFKDDGSVAHSILFTTGITTTVSTWTVSGTAGNLITINSTTTGTHALTKSGVGDISSDYLSIQHSVASPANTWYAGVNSTNNQATATAGSGWVFTAPVGGDDISGTVYSDEGVTPLTSKTIAISINGAAAATTTTSDASTGAYSFSDLTITSGDVVTIYIDGATEDAVTVTKVGASDLTGVDLYQNRLITRSDNGSALTNSNLDTANNNADTDITAIYTNSGTTITVAAGKELFIPTSHSYTPGATLTVGTGGMDLRGTFTHGSETLTVGSGGFSQSAGTFTGGSGTVDINGTYTLSGGTFTSTSGTMTVTSSWTHTAGGTFTHNSGTVASNLSANSTWDVSTSETFNNLSVTTSGISSTAMTIASGDTLIVLGTFTHTDAVINTGTVEARGNVTIGASANGGSATISFTETANQTITASGGSTGAFNINKASGTVSGGTGNFSIASFTLSSGTFTSTSGTLTVRGAWTHTAGGTFTHNSGTVAINLSSAATWDVTTSETFNNLSVTTSGVSSTALTITSGDSLIVVGTFTHTDAVINTGTIEAQGNVVIGVSANGGTALLKFTGTANQTYTDSGGNEPDGDITINKASGTVTLASNADWGAASQDLTITSGTLDLAGFNLTASNVFTLGASGTLQLQGSETVSTIDTVTAGSTVIYNGTGSYLTALAAGNTYSNLTFNGSGGVWEPNGAVSVGSNLTITAGTFDIDGQNLTVTGTFSNSDKLRLQGGETTVSLTNDTDSGTVEYDGTASYTGLKAGNSYNNLTFNGTGGTWTLGASLTVNGNLTITAGTLDTVSGQNYGLTVGGNWSNAGTFTARSGTVTFNKSSGTQTVNSGGTAAGQTFYNLTHSGAGILQLITNAVTVTNNLTNSAGTLDGNGLALNVAGTWNNTGGTYTAGSNTVTLNGTNQSILGATTFYNLIKTVTTAATLTFEAAKTQVIAGALTLQGAANQLLSLVSSIPGTQWLINPQGTRTVGYVNVQDSNNSNATAVTADNSQNSLNNTNWTFSATTVTWTGTTSTSYGTATNWDVGYVPNTTDNIVIADVTNDPILDTNRTVNNLTINSGGILSLNGNNFALTGTVTNNGTFKLQGGETVTGFTNDTDSGTVEYVGTGTYSSLAAGNSYYHLTLNGSGGSWTHTSTLDVNGNLTITAGTLLSSGQNVTLAGNFANSGTYTPGSNTVTLDGAADQTITTNNQAFNNLTLNNTGASGSDDIIISGAFDINGTLTITDGDLDVSTNDPSVTLAGDVTIGASGTIDNAIYSGTWTFDGSGTDTLTDNTAAGTNFRAVTVDGTSSKVLQFSSGANTPAITFTTLTVGADDTVSLNGENATITTLVNNGTFRLQGGETVTVTTYDTDSGTTEYVGTGTYSSLAAGNSYYHLTFNGLGGSWTHTGTLDVNGNLTITLGTLLSGGQTITLAGNWSNAGSYSSGSNTITFDAASGTQTLTSGGTGTSNDFNNLTKSGGGTLQFVTNGVDADGTLTISSSTTVDLNGQNLTSVTTLVNNGTLLLEGGETVTITTKDTDSGTVTYDGTGSYLTALAYGNTYYNLTFNGTGGVWEPNGAVTVNNNLTLTSGTFDVDGQNLTVTGTYSNDTTLRLLGTETVTLTNDTNSGTVSYDNTATLSDFPANLDDTYYNLTLAGAGAVQLAAALDANNNLTVSSGATLNLNGFDFTVGGNFVNSGTLSNSSARTLTLDGTTQTLNPASGTTLGTVALTGSSGTVSAGSNFSIGTLLSIAAGRVMNLVSYLLTSLGAITNSGTLTESSGYIIDASSGFYIADSNFDIDDAISLGSDAVYISLTDEDGNVTGGSADTLSVTVSCPTDSETVTLTETGAATEVFRNSGLTTALYSGSATNNNGTLTCANATTITATWTDPQDSSDTQSDTATATTDTVPTAPSTFAGTAASSASINWTWADNSSNETGFKLYSSAGTLLATISTANTVSYTETGLTAATSYTRKVAAYNAAGNSSFTSTATVTTDAAATPTPTPSTGAPTAPVLKSPANEVTLTTNTLTFTFTRSTDTDLANYSLRLTPASGSTEVITFNNPGEGSTTALSKATVTAQADTISVTITDAELLNDGDWTWKVRATDDAANTTDSTSRSFTIDTSTAQSSTGSSPATTARNPGTPATTTPTTTSELATHPLTIADIIEQINRGETPTKAPTALQLDELAKQARLRQQKQADNLFAFLQRFIPYDKLTFFNNWFDRFLALLHNQVRTMAYQSLQRLASLTGFGREQLLALRELFTNRATRLATERENMTRSINQEFASVSTEQATTLANVLLEAQQQLAARATPPDQATLKRLRAAAPDLPTPDLTRLTELAQNTLTQTNQTLLNRRTKALHSLSGIPRFVGRTILVMQTTGSRLHGWLIAARTNRLQLARGNEARLNTAAVPIRLALNRTRLAAQLAYEALQGRQDEPLAITDVAIAPTTAPDRITISWRTSRLTTGKVNWGPSLSYGADGRGGEAASPTLQQSHTVELTNLTPNTRLYFEVVATDARNHSTADAYYSFVTPEK